MNGTKIIIVEDEAIIALESKNYLESLGYEVLAIFNSGKKTIMGLKKLQPNLILMDINLKGDLDGIETVKKIQTTHQIPVVYLTAYCDDVLLERAKNTRPYGYVLKPFRKNELKVTIEMAIYVSRIEMEKEEALNDLQNVHDELEKRVAERTASLKKTNEKLQNEIIEHKLTEENLKKSEEEIKKSQKQAIEANESKSRFLAKISHELRTPMHQILSFSNFGINKIDQTDKTKLLHYFTLINKIGNSMNRLLDDILDLSKLESGKMEYEMKEEDLAKITDNVTDEFQTAIKEKNLALQIVQNGDIPIIFGDSVRLSQVIRNLMSNAIKFTPPEKKITITINNDKLPFQIKANGNNGALSFSIRNEGIGIPKDELTSIFQQFIQSSKTKNRPGSTGLGLAISQEIIKAHKGFIFAENHSEGGTVFKFSLPVLALGKEESKLV
jgi:signal transduction histidine kinase